MLGLGSIVGTGVFVSIGIAAGVAGPAVVPAIVLAALVAACNGISSAQLAANHPVSGGTYEYGYRYLVPLLGFVAGTMFLVAKSASAATAALGAAGYVVNLFAGTGANTSGAAGAASPPVPLVPVALAVVTVFTVIVARGIRSSRRTNTVVVSTSLLALVAFVVVGLIVQGGVAPASFTPFFADPDAKAASFLNAAALMFVAYTGYGRIATLGEEVRNPRRTIPIAVISTLVLTMLLYTSVATVAVSALGAGGLASAAGSAVAPLEVAAGRLGLPGLAVVLAVGAVTAMAGVLLNLLLGLSRVVLAMARRRDLPPFFTRIHAATASPRRAVFAVGILVCALVAVGDVRLTWSFSAFTVLVYYAITNLAALFIPREERMFPRWISVVGLAACLSLAAFVPIMIMLAGGGVIAAAALLYSVKKHRIP
jgi:APA family basic amino acid/polyamine antiporter